ncbi:hypothetical protein CJ030_MR7G015240 [Morella rubra]|uniref:Uncharacterized protein n=1 Tax=Morella rubra TaxID=262757 RepID=A0A6A1UXU0_9ROSI|nr:hypothetical protein CJ030_MR7G015240 [Morella rubra]
MPKLQDLQYPWILKSFYNNAVTAEHLQEEIRRLSMEMTSKLDEHEMQVMKAQKEANEFYLQKINLEEMVQTANEELGLIKDQNELKQQELLKQIESNEKQIQKMTLELQQKSMQIESAQENEREQTEAFSVDIQMLRAEVEVLIKNQCNFSEHTDLRYGTSSDINRQN